ncbi:RNase adapter RapZ [Deltaproteobacteria bacterium TL4]
MALTVSIYSFGFQVSGIPKNEYGDGGGFVFDCRCLPNPAKSEGYRSLTGRDLPVQKWLEQYEEVSRFAQTCESLVEQCIASYEDRGFGHLMVSYGCTGGQHRSVYLSERLSHKLISREGLIVSLTHTEQKRWPENCGSC